METENKLIGKKGLEIEEEKKREIERETREKGL